MNNNTKSHLVSSQHEASHEAPYDVSHNKAILLRQPNDVSRWRQLLASAVGVSRRRQPNDISRWRQPLASAVGVSCWRQPLASAVGISRRRQPSASANVPNSQYRFPPKFLRRKIMTLRISRLLSTSFVNAVLSRPPWTFMKSHRD